jgi:DNA-binding transcriptional LysR family regulator
MIKRNHIRHFLAIADAGSFVHAAARLHITQPTLSTSIAELERLVDARLFVRDRRRIRLTEAGGAFLPIARDLERGFRAADSFARGGTLDALEWPSLRLGVIRSIAEPILAAIVEVLAADFGIEMIEGTDYELRGALASGRIHCALTLLREAEAGLLAHRLWSEPYVMMASTRHPLAGRASIDPEELASDIMIARRSCEILEETSRFFTRIGVRPRFALRGDSDARCMAMVAAGLGITTAPASLAVPETVSLPLTGYDFQRTVGLVYDPAWLGHARDGLLSRLDDAVAAVLAPVMKAGCLTCENPMAWCRCDP